MRIYLAARYSRRLELCGYREQLMALGHVVEARWLDGGHQISDDGRPIGDDGEGLVEGDSGSVSEAAAALRSKFAGDDLDDVLAADCVISFTEAPRSGVSRGGRHVELGIAIGACLSGDGRIETRLIVVGHRENIFHWWGGLEFFETWPAALATFNFEP